MKIQRIIAIIILGGLAALSAGIHENTGTYGYQFLNISADPINLALGGRGIQASLEQNAFIYQPAAGCINSHRILGASHLRWLDDTVFNSLYYGYSDRLSHFGLSLRNLDYGEVENRDDTGALLGYYHPTDLSVMANYALRLGPSSYAGINGGIAYQKISTASSLALHADLGISTLIPVKNTTLSLSVRNLGISTKMNEARTPMPISVELDLGKKFQFDQGSLILEASALKSADSNYMAVLSTQFDVMERVALRGAYKFNHDSQKLSAGIGVKAGPVDINYGWADFNSGLNDVHSFGLSWRF